MRNQIFVQIFPIKAFTAEWIYMAFHTVFVAVDLGVFHTERFRDRGTRDIGIQDTNLKALSLQEDGQHRGDKRFTNAALAADNTDNVLDVAERVLGDQKTLRLGSGRAVARAGGAIVITFRHFIKSFRGIL